MIVLVLYNIMRLVTKYYILKIKRLITFLDFQSKIVLQLNLHLHARIKNVQQSRACISKNILRRMRLPLSF